MLAFDLSTRTWSGVATTGHYPGPGEMVEAVAMHGHWLYCLAWSEGEGMLVYRLDVPKKKWSRVNQTGEVPPPR